MHDRLVDILKAKASENPYRRSPGFYDRNGTAGNRRQREHIEDVLGRSVAAGASIVCGGRAPPDKPAAGIRTYIVIAADNSVACVTEELLEVLTSSHSFDTEEEAIAKANDTKFGLASASSPQVSRALTG